MVIVLIRRCVKRDKEKEFLASYNHEKPNNPGFIDETLTKLNDSPNLPDAMRSLKVGCEDCVTYLNIARWRSAEEFRDHFKPQTTHDAKIECSDRLRAVFEIV
jgi:heme-degrading monooxygenase HmoA